MDYVGTTTFAALLVVTTLLFSATPSTAQNFKCTTSANCTSLVGYVFHYSTTIGEIPSFFNVKKLRSILGANNLPLSTLSNYTIHDNQIIRIPVSCHCINNTGVVRNMPVYTVKAGNTLYDVATFVSGGLVTYSRIREVNNIPDGNLIEGQNLSIPLPCSCDDVKGEKVVHYGHVVQPGSSLAEIALKFGTDIETLMELNGITDEKKPLANQPLDVPLRACNSSIRSDSIDSGLNVANDTYVFTASDCVKCKCDAANDWTLKCEPSGLELPSNQTCPPMICQRTSLVIGNVSSDGCSSCAYEGYLNQTTILTNVVQLSTCPRSSKMDLRTKVAIGVSAGLGAIVIISVVFYMHRYKYFSKNQIISVMFYRYRNKYFSKNQRQEEEIEALIKNYGFLAPKRYNYSDVKKMTNSFTDKVGQGGFGVVYKGKLPDGRVVAVKVLSKSEGNGEEFMNEVACISRTSHINIVTFLGFCYERNKRALIYEFMPNGSLDKFIYDQGSSIASQLLEWKTLNQIVVGVARGLEYLHRGCNTRIVHFDIKPHNILLDEEFCPKIADFGLAKLCKMKESIISMRDARGTIGYIAPEIFYRNFGGVSYKSDVYGFGMMVLEIVGVRKNIASGVSRTNSEVYFPDWIYKKLEPGEVLTVHGIVTEEEELIARKLILVSLWCIQTNPSDRPSMTKVVEMLEGSIESLQVPPKHFLDSSPVIPLQQSSSTSASHT